MSSRATSDCDEMKFIKITVLLLNWCRQQLLKIIILLSRFFSVTKFR